MDIEQRFIDKLEILKITFSKPLIPRVIFKLATSLIEGKDMSALELITYYKELHKEKIEIPVKNIEEALIKFKSDELNLTQTVETIIKNIHENK